MAKSIERCDICNEPTGRAGRGDDSIYVELTNGETVGPLCTDCRDEIQAHDCGASHAAK